MLILADRRECRKAARALNLKLPLRNTITEHWPKSCYYDTRLTGEVVFNTHSTGSRIHLAKPICRTACLDKITSTQCRHIISKLGCDDHVVIQLCQRSCDLCGENTACSSHSDCGVGQYCHDGKCYSHDKMNPRCDCNGPMMNEYC